MLRIVSLGLLLIFSLAAAMTVLAVLTRAVRLLGEARRNQLMARHRRLLLEFAAGEGDPEALVNMPDRVWRALEPSAVELLGKVRGEAREALADVFERRGAAAKAMADLRGGGLIRRARAAELLGTLGHLPAVPELCLLLDERHPDLRVVCVRALGRLGAPAAAPALLRSLTGPRANPSHLVAHALTQLGPDANPALIRALDHIDPQVRITALEALGLRGTAAARGKIAELLAHDDSLEVRTRAAAVLGRVGTKSTVDSLLAATDVAQPAPLRGQAARSLGELGIRPAVERLAHLLADPHYEVAHQAARALLRLGSAGRQALETAAAQGSPTPPGAAEDSPTPPGAAQGSPTPFPGNGREAGLFEGHFPEMALEARSAEAARSAAAGAEEARSAGAAARSAAAHAVEAIASQDLVARRAVR